MNRPDDLQRGLASVYQADSPPEQTIVSDDSADGRRTAAVAAEFPRAVYQEGPHRGLGPNRNRCLKAVNQDYVLFIDDDVCVPPDFFVKARRLLSRMPSDAIVTGFEMKEENGESHKVMPHNADFWGLQRAPVLDGYRAIVINATLFPRALFDKVSFDEQLRYGSEEIDVARHAVALGFKIEYTDDLFVYHRPSPENRDLYRQFVHASRLYATTKAYLYYERSLFKALAYVVLAPIQLLGSAAKRHDMSAMRSALRAVSQAVGYWRANSRQKPL